MNGISALQRHGKEMEALRQKVLLARCLHQACEGVRPTLRTIWSSRVRAVLLLLRAAR